MPTKITESQFIIEAQRRNKSDDEIADAMQKFRDEFGEFAQEGQGEVGTEQIAKQQLGELDVQGALFPRTQQIAGSGRGSENVELMGLKIPFLTRERAAAGADLLSLPGRTVMAGLTTESSGRGPGATGPTFRQQLAKTEAGGELPPIRRLAENIVRSPSTGAVAAAAPVSGPLLGGAKFATQAAGGLLEGASSAIGTQLERGAKRGQISPGEAAIETGAGILGPVVSGVRKLIKPGELVKRGLTGLGDLNIEAVERAAKPGELEKLRAAARATGGEGQTKVGGELLEKLEKLETGRLAETERGLESLRGRALSKGEAGESLGGKIQGAKEKLMEGFREGEKRIAGIRETPASEKIKESSEVIRDVLTGKFKKVVKKEPDPLIEKKIIEAMSDFKALPGQGVPKASDGAISAVKNLMSHEVKNVDDLINMKARARGMQLAGRDGKFVFDKTVDDAFIQKVITKIDETMEQSIKEVFDKRKANRIIEIMRANNKRYGEAKGALQNLEKSIVATKSSENMIGKIKNFGPAELKDMLKKAKTNPALKEVTEELKSGFVDDLIFSGYKGGKFDRKAFVKNWDDISDDLKKVMLSDEQQRRFRILVEESRDPQLGSKIFGPGMKKTVGVNKLENILTKREVNREALEELKVIDQTFGLEGKDSFTQKLTDAFQAKQLRIDSKGRVEITPVAKTGKSRVLSGIFKVSAVGGGIEGASEDPSKYFGVPIIGGLAGLYLQSPHAAIMAFRAINKMRVPTGGMAGFRRVLSEEVQDEE